MSFDTQLKSIGPLLLLPWTILCTDVSIFRPSISDMILQKSMSALSFLALISWPLQQIKRPMGDLYNTGNSACTPISTRSKLNPSILPSNELRLRYWRLVKVGINVWTFLHAWTSRSQALTLSGHHSADGCQWLHLKSLLVPSRSIDLRAFPSKSTANQPAPTLSESISSV